MQNITARMLQYREAARLLWNGFLREEDAAGGGEISTDDGLDDWLRLKQLLFTAVVLRHTGDREHARSLLDPSRFSWWNKPIPFIRVVPAREVTAQVSRTSGRGGCWDHPVKTIRPDDDLRFIDFFDWGQAGYLDFQYFHVEIVASRSRPELVGHHALVDVRKADVFVLADTRRKKRGRSGDRTARRGGRT
jgi:hypothetical protein